MKIDPKFAATMEPKASAALAAMDALEKGAIANPDEQRPVGHYWLRAPDLAPDPKTRADIESTINDILQFATGVHEQQVQPEQGGGFFVLLVIGIGGSILGPELLVKSLAPEDAPMVVMFLDNTDPDGIDRTLAELEETLAQTLTLVISKSGATVETQNTMLEVKAAYESAGLDFARHAVAVTCENSRLHQRARSENWLETFFMWDFVGGRFSLSSAAGLLPAALAGVDITELLDGAATADRQTRQPEANPALALALAWHHAVAKTSRRNMVVMPYKDRLAVLPRYLQQLVMESIGKATDRAGAAVHHGLTVYGNKGSTDQHALVQQLRDGANDFFATFVHVLEDREGDSIDLGDQVTAGDYLLGMMLGTRQALSENDRPSITITLDALTPAALGALIAVMERAVGIYAEFNDLNAYHQPGVEAGKLAANEIVKAMGRLLSCLHSAQGRKMSVEQLARDVGNAPPDTVHIVLQHLATTRPKAVRATPAAADPDAQFWIEPD